MMIQPVSYRDGDADLNGFLAWDETRRGQRPGILVVHGGRGLDEHAKERTRRLAARGFVALACDMYGAGLAGNRERVLATIKAPTGHRSPLSASATGIAVLASHPQVDGRLAAVGYCFGGMTVLELARAGAQLAGVASIHGSLKTNRLGPTSTMNAKVLVCHGALDPHVPIAHVTAFIDEMNSARADWRLIVYGGAMHGFTDANAAAYNTPGVGYDALADARSATAMEQFLGEVFS
jgi:dienelactone hydrolase